MLRVSLLALLFLAGTALEAQAGGGCCQSCGCPNMKKVCKPVCDVKKEIKFVYDCVCEDFCVPGPSKFVACCQKTDCDGCVHCCPVRQPTCAAVRTRTKLVKTAVEVEKPTIKWVVQTVCCGCGCVCNHGCADGACTSGSPAPAAAAPQVPQEAPMPPPPAPIKQASFERQPSALLEILSQEQR